MVTEDVHLMFELFTIFNSLLNLTGRPKILSLVVMDILLLGKPYFHYDNVEQSHQQPYLPHPLPPIG